MIRRSIVNAVARLFGNLNVKVRLGVAQSSDPDVVLAALSTAAAWCPGALNDPAPDVTFDDICENALVFSVTVAIRDVTEAGRIETALRTKIIKALRERDIAIAKPQVDVHLRALLRHSQLKRKSATNVASVSIAKTEHFVAAWPPITHPRVWALYHHLTRPVPLPYGAHVLAPSE